MNKTDRHTETDTRNRTHYHGLFAGGKNMKLQFIHMLLATGTDSTSKTASSLCSIFSAISVLLTTENSDDLEIRFQVNQGN